MEKQRTLKAPVQISGVGLHTGLNVSLTIQPAPEDYGYRFSRKDLDGEPEIKGDIDNVVSTERGTTLGENGVKVHTTEHVLAALYGLQVDNARIEMDGPEVPILDGSAEPFADAIEKVGYEQQGAERNYYVLQENFTYDDPETGVEMLAVPTRGEEFRLTVMVDYNSRILGTQHASMYNIGEFRKEIAGCRTFVFLRELEGLAKSGLIKGGDLDNAIVLVDMEDVTEDYLKRLARLLGREEDLEVQVSGIGILNNSELKFQNEPARHKLLDMIGDLALLGRPIKGHILAARPGHTGNVAFTQMLRNKLEEEEKAPPRFDLSKEPLYDVNEVKRFLPHRHPFLMVDKILEMDDTGIVGVKNVTVNEPFFPGHFPNEPLMPGVMQIEAMAQVGGIFALNTVPDPENYLTYFMKIDNSKFKRKVVPGDTVIFKLDLLRPIRRGIIHMTGKAYVNQKVVTESEMMAKIEKVKDHE